MYEKDIVFVFFLTSITTKTSFILLLMDETTQQNFPGANEIFASDFNNDDYEDEDVSF
jgi:hypothetical protein